MMPQGEQADFELRHWDGDPNPMSDKWIRLLDVYSEIEESSDFGTGRRLIRGDSSESAETARIVIVPSAPGAVDSGAGRMLTGQVGSVLDNLLELIGLTRADTFITPLIKYRLPGNRPPVMQEMRVGLDWLYKELDIINPLLLVALGRSPHIALQGRDVGRIDGFERGRIFPHWGLKFYVASMHEIQRGLTDKSYQPIIEQDWLTLGAEIRKSLPELLV